MSKNPVNVDIAIHSSSSRILCLCINNNNYVKNRNNKIIMYQFKLFIFELEFKNLTIRISILKAVMSTMDTVWFHTDKKY